MSEPQRPSKGPSSKSGRVSGRGDAWSSGPLSHSTVIFFTTSPVLVSWGDQDVFITWPDGSYSTKGKAVFPLLPRGYVTGTEKHTLLLEQKGGTGVWEGDRGPEPGPLRTPHGGGSWHDDRSQEGDVRCSEALSFTKVGNRPVRATFRWEADDEGMRWQNVKCNQETPLSPCFSFSAHSFPLCVPIVRLLCIQLHPCF